MLKYANSQNIFKTPCLAVTCCPCFVTYFQDGKYESIKSTCKQIVVGLSIMVLSSFGLRMMRKPLHAREPKMQQTTTGTGTSKWLLKCQLFTFQDLDENQNDSHSYALKASFNQCFISVVLPPPLRGIEPLRGAWMTREKCSETKLT